MVRFLAPPFSNDEGSWGYSYCHNILQGFKKLGIPCKMYLENTLEESIQKIKKDDIAKEDIFLFGALFDHAIDILHEVYPENLKFAHSHGLLGDALEPGLVNGWDLTYGVSTVPFLDKVFLNSNYAINYAKLHNSSLANSDKLVVTGFPMDLNILHSVSKQSVIKRSIGFNQRFSLDKNSAFVVYLTDLLIEEGFSVYQLIGGVKRSLTDDLKRFVLAGGEIIYSEDKEIYYQNLSSMEYVLHTSLYESFGVSAIEAIVLGCKWLGPDCMTFTELFPSEWLYQSYLVKEIIEKLHLYPQNVTYDFSRYEYTHVVKEYLKWMGL